MAILKPQSGGNRMFELDSDVMPPKGTHIASCLEVKDVYGVERKKFQSEEMETVDLTAFLFGFRDKQGNAHKIASKSMKISSSEKSALHAFLRSWLGESPKMGWDYCELKGSKALITVDHESRNDRQYANIVSISPLPEGMVEPKAAPAKASKAKAAPAPVVIEDDGEESDEVPF